APVGHRLLRGPGVGVGAFTKPWRRFDGRVGQRRDAPGRQELSERLRIGGHGPRVASHDLEHEGASWSRLDRAEDRALLEHDVGARGAQHVADCDLAVELVDDVVSAVTMALDEHAGVVSGVEDSETRWPLSVLLPDGDEVFAD